MARRRKTEQAADVATPGSARRRILVGVLGGLIVVGLFAWRMIAVEFACDAARRAFRRYESHVALSWLEWAERLDHRNPETLLLLGRAHAKLENPTEAAGWIERAREAGCDPERCRRETWLLQARLGRFREVEQHFPELLADPGGEQAEIGEALFLGYRAARRFARARQVLDAWQADDPQDPQPHFLGGLLLDDAGFADLAEEAYRGALELQPTHGPASLALARSLVERHQLPAALSYYLPCLERQPESETARLGVARCYRLQARLDAARTALLGDREVEPRRELLAELGAVEVAAGNYARAVELLTKVYRQSPHSALMRQQLALALAGAGEHEQANQHFAFLDLEQRHRTRIGELAANVNQDAGNTEARVEVGKLLLELESDEEALSWLYGALEIDPQLPTAHAVLADFYERRKGSHPNDARLARQHRALAVASDGD